MDIASFTPFQEYCDMLKKNGMGFIAFKDNLVIREGTEQYNIRVYHDDMVLSTWVNKQEFIDGITMFIKPSLISLQEENL